MNVHMHVVGRAARRRADWMLSDAAPAHVRAEAKRIIEEQAEIMKRVTKNRLDMETMAKEWRAWKKGAYPSSADGA